VSRSKSQQLVTIPRRNCYQIALKAGGVLSTVVCSYFSPDRRLACNRELPRIPFFAMLRE
jgi:hypothetical protein